MIWVDENRPIETTFETGAWKLYEGACGTLGLPTEAFLRLVAVRNKKKRLLHDVEALQKIASIRTPDGALEYVRLFTSPESHYLFPNVEMLEPREDGTHSELGTYGSDYAERVGLQEAEVTENNGKFIIRRNLLKKNGPLIRSTERVKKNGEYALLKAEEIDTDPPITYPVYE